MNRILFIHFGTWTTAGGNGVRMSRIWWFSNLNPFNLCGLVPNGWTPFVWISQVP